MLKYSLVENAMTTDTNTCVAVVSSPENRNLDDVISFMVSEGTGLSRPQAMAYFEKLTQTILYFLGDGHSVTTPLFRVRPSISGMFNGKIDNFDPSRHQVNIRASAGLRLRSFAADIKLEKVPVNQHLPAPDTFIDGSSSEINTSVSPGGIGMLHGNHLRFDATDIQQGIFFVPLNDPANAIRAAVYINIKPSEIYFQIPNLPTGEYYIEVKVLPKNGKVILSGKLVSVISA